MNVKEEKVQDFLLNNFSRFNEYITNYEEFIEELESHKKVIYESTSGHILISDLIKSITIERILRALPLLDSLIAIGKEFPLIDDGSRGRKSSADILAYHEFNKLLAIIELKVSHQAERQAVTELSAYNQGLQNRFRGLSALDVLWIPISTDWRKTTKSAIEFQILWKNILSVPLKLDVIENEGEISDIKMNCFNPVDEINETESLNLFSSECFDKFQYYTTEEIKDKHAFINYISSESSRNNVNGFIIFHKPVDAMYPYGFTICTFNPYKGYFHKRTCQSFVEEYGLQELYENYNKGKIINSDYCDYDFRTEEFVEFEETTNFMDSMLEEMKDQLEDKGSNSTVDIEGSTDEEPIDSKTPLYVSDFFDPETDTNLNFLFEKLKTAIDSNVVNRRALGTPDFDILFDQLNTEDIDFVCHLGIYQELISERIKIQHKRGIKDSDFFYLATSFAYLKEVFHSYNNFNSETNN